MIYPTDRDDDDDDDEDEDEDEEEEEEHPAPTDSIPPVHLALSALISELQSADHRRQGVIKELWASDHKRQVQLTKALQLLKGLQTQMTEFQRQHGPAKGSAQPDAPGEAGSSS
ncbi:hypothetical protein Tco_0285343 [Tanacetum coccineum]